MKSINMTRILKLIVFLGLFFNFSGKALDLGQWQGIHDLSHKQQLAIQEVTHEMLSQFQILGNIGKSRNIVTVKTDTKYISFISGLIPIQNSIKSKFQPDCYDFCDIILGDKSSKFRSLFYYFSEQSYNLELKSIIKNSSNDNRNILNKENTGIDFNTISMPLLILRMDYLSQLTLSSSAKQAQEKLLDTLGKIKQKSELYRSLMIKYIEGLKDYLAFLQSLNISSLNSRLNAAQEQTSYLLRTCNATSNADIDILRNIFQSNIFTDKILPWLHSETLFRYTIHKTPQILGDFRTDIIIFSTKRDMCLNCENIISNLASTAGRIIVTSTEEYEKSWERHEPRNSQLLKIPLDTSVRGDFRLPQESDTRQQITQIYLPIFSKMHSARGICFIFGTQTPEHNLGLLFSSIKEIIDTQGESIEISSLLIYSNMLQLLIQSCKKNYEIFPTQEITEKTHESSCLLRSMSAFLQYWGSSTFNQ